MNVLNLTRKFIPKVSAIKAENINAINLIPENILTKMVQDGDKTVVKVGMNDNAAVRILENKTKTIFTDGLNGCNGVQCVARGLDGNPIAIQTHYTPLEASRTKNVDVFENQLNTYEDYIDKNYKPKVFYNVRGHEVNGKLIAYENPLISQLKSVFDKFFKQGYEEKIIPYEAKDVTPFDSKAMISQFEKTKTGWDMKLTSVGEQEHYFDNLFG